MSGYGALKLLAYANNSAGASAQVVAPVFDPENLLEIAIRIAGYSGASVGRLQFNGDAGTTNYSYGVMEGNGAPSTGVAGAAAGINCAVTTGVGRGLIVFRVRNFISQEHGIEWGGSSGSLVAATAPTIISGAGIWANTARITQVTLDVGSGGGTLNAGSEIAVYGVS